MNFIRELRNLFGGSGERLPRSAAERAADLRRSPGRADERAGSAPGSGRFTSARNLCGGVWSIQNSLGPRLTVRRVGRSQRRLRPVVKDRP